MSLCKVTRNYQVTIPSSIRQVLRIKIGSLVDFVMDKGAVVLKPKALVDEGQAWFWTRQWQAGERSVEEDKRKGRVKKFKSVQEAKRHFEK